MRSAATYRIFGGPGLTAAEVTRRLGVRPTTAAEAGRRTSAIRAESLWCLSTSTADTESAAHLRQVLDVLEPRRAELWELAEAGWFCLVASHAVELDRRLLARLLSLPGELLLDVCGDETG